MNHSKGSTGFGISLLTLFSWLEIARHDNAQVPFFICRFQLVIAHGIFKLVVGPAEMHYATLDALKGICHFTDHSVRQYKSACSCSLPYVVQYSSHGLIGQFAD